MNVYDFKIRFKEWALDVALTGGSSPRAVKDLIRSMIANALFDVTILHQFDVNMLARSLLRPKNTNLQPERDGPLTLLRPKIIKLLKALCALRGIIGSPDLTWRRRSLLRRLYRETIR